MTHAVKTIWPFYVACVAVLMLVAFITAPPLSLPAAMR